ncbi:MAG: LysR substrate-binding domain-containing protein [Tropicimonas sp.]|uniref:LysR substrate-binding domain-containing protein n=1 Tax=Tropicimonas sp. TaxID=2067044 RepID=UPI003A88701C
MPPRITIRQIEAFCLVMTRRTMTGAAERMSISQPAVSRLISDLEAALDMRLFERAGPRLRATSAALRLIGEVDRVFLGLDYVEEAARRIRRFPMDPYRIAAPPFLSQAFLARLVARVTREIPDLTISLHTDASHAIAEQVARGQHDIGFCTLGTMEQDLTVLHRARIVTVCLLPRGHPLADRQAIDVTDLEGEKLFVLGRSGGIRPQINEVFEHSQIVPRIVGEVLHAPSCAAFVAEGLGVALLDQISARSVSDGSTLLRPFTPHISLEISMVAPKRVNSRDVNEAFLRHLPETITKSGG